MIHSFAVAVLLSGAAQAPLADTIAQQLSSADARTIAWGAFSAGAYQRVEAIPRLEQLLESPPPIGLDEERAVVDVVMDALIQLNARVPARLVVPYVQRRPVQAFVLLSRASDREGVLLELLPQLSGMPWFAAANILLEDRSAGLAEHLIRTVKLRLTVHLTDTEGGGLGVGGGGFMGIGCGVGQDPPGYPPHAEYRFAFGPQRGLIVLAPGPRPVYYSRTVTSSFQYGVSELNIGGPNDEDRIEYLQKMAPDTAGIPFRAHTFETVAWSTADALSKRVWELHSLVQRRFQYLVDRIREFLPLPADLGEPSAIEVRIADERLDKGVPLPRFDR